MAWRARRERKVAEEKERLRTAYEKAKLICGRLKAEYGAKYVYLFGSLAWGKHFSPISDIDLLVEGLPEEVNYWKMLADMEHLAAPFSLQIVLAEDAEKSLVEKVRTEGVLL